MTYLAPRQGLFAIILLISFCIQSLFFVVSTERQLDEMRVQTGERMMAQLVDETKLPLLSQDRVSLSVIAKRYTADYNVSSLTIRDPNGAVLVQTGSAPLQGGDQVQHIATADNKALGTLTLTLTENSKGEIIASQWPFLLGSFILNLLIWLLYGYMARPTKAQLSALSREVQEHYLAQQPRPRRLRRDENADDLQSDEFASDTHASTGTVMGEGNQNDDSVDAATMASLLGHGSLAAKAAMPSSTATVNMHQALNQYVQSHQGTTSQDNPHELASSERTDNASQTSEHTPSVLPDMQSEPASAPDVQQQNKATGKQRPFDTACIQIHYVDKYNLIAALAPEKSTPYFALCTQLLQQGIDEILSQPLFFGVTLINNPTFDAKGARVLLKATTSHAKVGLAAVILSKLYVMLNQIIVAKHHELKQFAAKVKIGVSDQEHKKPVAQLIENLAQEDEIIILLPSDGVKQLNGQVQLRNVANPMTVYERECALFEGTNDAMVQRLVDMRDAVLLPSE